MEKLARDAKITQIYEGANNIQRLVAYRQLVRILRNKGGVLGGGGPPAKCEWGGGGERFPNSSFWPATFIKAL